MSNTDKKNNRGGARPGAGRHKTAPHLLKKNLGLALPGWLVAEIDKLPGSRAAVIEAALVEKFGWTPPKG